MYFTMYNLWLGPVRFPCLTACFDTDISNEPWRSTEPRTSSINLHVFKHLGLAVLHFLNLLPSNKHPVEELPSNRSLGDVDFCPGVWGTSEGKLFLVIAISIDGYRDLHLVSTWNEEDSRQSV